MESTRRVIQMDGSDEVEPSLEVLEISSTYKDKALSEGCLTAGGPCVR